MHCADARDEDLFRLCHGGVGREAEPRVRVTVMLTCEEFEEERAKGEAMAMREMLGGLAELFAEEAAVPPELQHARAMLAQWEEHAAGARATAYAIAQRGHWQRRVDELELGPVDPLPEPGKIVAMPKAVKRKPTPGSPEVTGRHLSTMPPPRSAQRTPRKRRVA